MPIIGSDCQMALDGVGYFVEPRTYVMHRPRLRKATVVKGGGERYVDLGPGKREWHMTVLCLNQLTDYSGAQVPMSGRAYREQLRGSYEKSPATGTTTLAFTDLDGAIYSVHFDHYDESVVDIRTQVVSPSYHVAIVLVEA